MCVSGGGVSTPKPTKTPVQRPPQEAPMRIDPTLLEKRAKTKNDLRRRNASRLIQGGGVTGPLATTNASLLEYNGE